MKKTLLPVLLAGLAYSAQAQTLQPTQVPAAVVATFNATFPAVKAPTWEKEGDHYEAGFTLNGATMSALLSPAGALLETETDMAPSHLPAPVRATLARAYPGYKVTEAATIVAASGATTYEAELSKHGKRQDVVFHADGTPAKK